MQGHLLIQWIILAGGMLLSILAGSFVCSAISNPLSQTVAFIGYLFFFISFIIPRTGFLLLLFLCAYSDFLKRLMVIFGSISIYDVKDILAIAPILAIALFSRSLCGILIKEYRLHFRHVAILLFLAAVSTSVIAFKFRATKDWYATLIFSANAITYISLLFSSSFFIRNNEDIEKLLTKAIIIFVPVAIYGIWQFFFGLAQFEVAYLNSGLTTMIKELYDLKPRPFSTLNSSHSLSIITATFFLVSLYKLILALKRPTFFLLIGWTGSSVLYAACCLATLGRSAWASVFLSLLAWFCFKTPRRTFLYYFAVFFTFFYILFNAETLLARLDSFQKFLPEGDERTEQAFRLGTYSDRLAGFRNILTNKVLWTPFGYDLKFRHIKEDETSHDMISDIIISHGYVPFFAILILTASISFAIHFRLLQMRYSSRTNTPAFILAALIGIIISGVFFGNHLVVFPINAIFWLFASMLFNLLFNFHQDTELRPQPIIGLIPGGRS